MTSISSNGGGGFGSSTSSGGGAKPGGQDPNGMERLVGESDEQYIARQTRLRDEAKARMAAKFGGSGGGGGMMMMGGVGSGGGGGSSRMGGIGSDPNYNPNGGGYGASDFDVSALSSTVMSGLGSAFGALSTVANTVTAAVADESTKRSVVETAGSFWGGLSKGASTLINTVTQPDGFDAGSDGLEDLQRQFHSQRSTQPSKYGGFGSDSMFAGSRPTTAGPSFASTTPNMQSTSTLGEARPGPGEDPNGIERLSGESDEQYVMRQTRLRDEAKARMAAKFGGGAGRMGGVGSSGGGGGMGSSSSSSGGGWGGGGGSSSSAPSSGGFGGMKPTPPPSGNFSLPRPTPPKPKVASGEDFFANFGT